MEEKHLPMEEVTFSVHLERNGTYTLGWTDAIEATNNATGEVVFARVVVTADVDLPGLPPCNATLFCENSKRLFRIVAFSSQPLEMQAN